MFLLPPRFLIAGVVGTLIVGLAPLRADETPASIDFGRDLMPMFSRLGCNLASCHGTPAGTGHFDLSLFGADALADHASLALAFHGRRINRVEPGRSLVLAKITGAIPHGGGALVAPDSAEADRFRRWIAEGAHPGNPALKVAAIEVAPAEATLAVGDHQQLTVTATFADGQRRHVTHEAIFQARDPQIATVSSEGVVHALAPGDAVVVASYLRMPAVASQTIPQDLPFAFPSLTAPTQIDELVNARLRQLRIPPSELSNDSEFLRRVYLDVIGTLPRPEESRAFLADTDPAKRAKLIDQLLDRPEFADFWALKWSDLLRIKSEYPVNVWPKAVQVYYAWLHESIQQNKPYDLFARELVTAAGSNFRSPPANFFRAMPGRNPQAFAETTSLIFLSRRINCAHCHGDPLEPVSRDDNLAMAAFFSRIAYKATQEWKEEIVYTQPEWELWHPSTKARVAPQLPGASAPAEIPPGTDPRIVFADWLTSPDNVDFARSIVNRVWYWLMGRGIVNEPDDMRPTNPPSNPELLEYLRQELVAHQFDLKHIYRLILSSEAYQRSSRPNPMNAHDVAHFSHRAVRRLGAEPLLDAIDTVTGNHQVFTSWIPVPSLHLPGTRRAIQLSDSDIDSVFLDVFGRPARDAPYEHDRNAEPQPRQSLLLLSSSELQWKIAGGARMKQFLESQRTDAEVVEDLYYLTLCRPPRDPERSAAVDFLARHADARPQAIEDLMWVMLNTREFLVIP